MSATHRDNPNTIHDRTVTIACAIAGLLLIAGGAAYPGHPAATTPEITSADLSVRDKAIADNIFQGRGPGTPDGEAAAQWIADEMKRIGLKPGNHGSWFQSVPAVNIALDPAQSSLVFNTGKGGLEPKFADQQVFWTPQFKSPDVSVANSPLVFVGYGIVAPDYNWNDYAGVDVKGKTVVILVNDPGNQDAAPDTKFFKGKAETYYGRWMYKYEEAARQGAAAAIIVHETIPAAYGWQVVRNSNSGNKSWLDTPDGNAGMVPIQGWITLETARDLFSRAGLDYDQQKAAANKSGFKAVAMTGETLTAHAHSTISKMKTRNVIGVVRGRVRPNEVFLYTAHWDHLGVKPDVAGPDKIYNGAVDNGMGVSSILEIAEKFAKTKPAPQRSVAFIAWTMEEQGLLGSLYFAQHPIWPLNRIVGGINIDANRPEGRAHDMVVVGNGASELEHVLSFELANQSRHISPDPEPEKGAFYRSDHLNLAKVGVPMLYPGGGYDLLNGGTAAGQAARDEYRDKHYHQPSDEWQADWDFSGPVSDLQVLYAVGNRIANSNDWPNWYEGNEFRAIRDKSMAGK